MAIVSTVFASCKEYGDNLRDIGSRVEALEASVRSLNSDIEALSSIVKAIEGRFYITNVAENSDGSYTLTFSDGSIRTLQQGKNGVGGKSITVTVAKDTDGVWYWQVNGVWMLDTEGNKLRANGTDGSAGSGSAIVPRMRINSVTGMWEISADSGITWFNTGVKANGEDGYDHTYDVIRNITVSVDGSMLTIVLVDGTIITLPCV